MKEGDVRKRARTSWQPRLDAKIETHRRIFSVDSYRPSVLLYDARVGSR